MYKIIFRIVISSLLVAYFSFKVEWGIILSSFLEIDILYYTISTIISIVCSLFLAFKHHQLIKNTRLELPITRLVAINFISRFYALFLPSALAPEAVRWYKVTKNKEGRSFFLASIMVERLFFVLTLLLFGTIPLFFYFENSQIILLRQRITLFIIFAYSIISLMLLYFLFPKIQIFLKNIIKKSGYIKKDSKPDQFLENFTIKNLSISLIRVLFLLSILWQLLFIGRMYFLFYAINLQLSIIDIAWMGSLILLLQIIPLSFAGLGVREGAFAYLFTLFGLVPEKGFLIGILFFSQMLILSAIGGILNLFEE